ncbi:ribokinase [Amnibacterium flavum]|uniref:Ribokinase n=1 Tax=Amnibacterium flavum TaxID=2173173 RepID=A0A2V1HTA8_9MICO|nr:ribokinase [Amnibacterium flavum]PVZ95803.1 ribokinase [Amnibacterium flavum]
MGRVVVVGSLNIDSVVEVERHPAPGETVRGGDLQQLFGGKGANQAVAAALAGAEVAMIGRVGDDEMGRRYLDRLTRLGIDVTGVRIDTGSVTGHAAIAVDSHGENTIIVSPGANARVSTDDLALLDSTGPGDVVLLQLEIDMTAVGEAVRRSVHRGARVVLNLAPYSDVPAEWLEAADPVVVNEHEAALLERAGLSASSLLTTLGGEGSRWGDNAVPADLVDDVVDTTGAGDSYCGTLAARLAAGDGPDTAMRAASAAAGASVRWMGAQPA